MVVGSYDQDYFVSAWILPVETVNTYYTIFDKPKNNYIIGVKILLKVVNSGQTGVFESGFIRSNRPG